MSLGVRVNAAAKDSHVDHDDAVADATNLLVHLIETGFIMRLGSVSAIVTHGGGDGRGRQMDPLLRPAE